MRVDHIDRERLERAARIYHSNRDAGIALGITPGSFGRMCRRFGIETPGFRKARLRAAARDGAE